MKPLWFYEAIPMLMQHDPKIALRAFDARLLDGVKAVVNIKRNFDTYYDWDIAPQGVQVLTQEETHVNIIDIPPPGQEKAFVDKTFLVRPESIVLYAKDMNPDNGQLRPYILFQSFMEDHKYPSIHLSHRMGMEHRIEYHSGNWERNDDWYFINPVVMEVNTGSKNNTRGIY